MPKGSIVPTGLGDIARSVDPVNVTTEKVASELARNDCSVPPWIEVVTLSDFAELEQLAVWTSLVSSGEHSRGEASVLAWAEVNEAIAIVDDGDARRVAAAREVEVHGTLWVVASSVLIGHLDRRSAQNLVDVMIAGGAYLPCERGGFLDWAERNALIPPE